MAALDLLGRRWMLRILWELRDGPVGFRDLRTRCDQASPTVLNTRLTELKETGIVTQNETRAYLLTSLGRELYESLEPLQRWANHWAAEIE
ncbi:winged helix-turn-helix transcriptional regulator [Kribbella albertanoniae]|uniref:Transcriptional regulator n=2 Tax=Kribbella albertanoniae TaxID=1266829 RepID=A0A4R4Q8A4_9ACTN|nr:transcriptional regulator [Kribbella albertanoniae]